MTKGLHKNSLRKGEPNKWIAEGIIETIRAEVERRIENLSYTNDFTAKSIIEVLDDILIFIDTLQEQPVCEDLEEEIRFERKKLMELFGAMNGEQSLAVHNFARHFYELGRQSKRKVSEDLEEEICRYFSKHPVKFITMWPELKNTALHFAEWQKEQDALEIIDAHRDGVLAGAKSMKEQMLREAVEGCVTMYANAVYPTLIGIRERIGEPGDKFRIIIVKED